MPVPLPAPEDTNLRPPDRAEVELLASGVMAAIAPPGGATELQQVLMAACFDSLTGHRVDTATAPPLGPHELALGLAARNAAFRTRILQTMILGALVLRPLPPTVAEQVDAYAAELGVGDDMLSVARRFAEGQVGMAAVDFDRNGYAASWSPERAEALRATGLTSAWEAAEHDPDLAATWAALEHLPAGTLGRRMWEFYRARGFEFPGSPGSAPPLLAQHDWVHVLADYGTKVESELEVFAFIARANDDPSGFSLLAMVVSLFETGYLATGAGLFEAFPGQLSREGMAVRIGDALRRGARSHGRDGRPDVDLLAVDWFALADRPVEQVRELFGVEERAAAAREAGSVGPWDPGGISEYQYDTARARAEAAGEPYLAYGATP
jgi:hypothetical protein